MDLPGPATVVLREAVNHDQQIVLNPLLTVLGWLLIRVAVTPPFSRWVAIPREAAIAASVLPLLLLQFHCLDCGRTFWMPRRQHHACEQFVTRRRAGIHGRQVFEPGVQARIWFWVLLLGIAAGAILLR